MSHHANTKMIIVARIGANKYIKTLIRATTANITVAIKAKISKIKLSPGNISYCSKNPNNNHCQNDPGYYDTNDFYCYFYKNTQELKQC